eukprot:3479962-Ditylum_brightwellii.AAC.1
MLYIIPQVWHDLTGGWAHYRKAHKTGTKTGPFQLLQSCDQDGILRSKYKGNSNYSHGCGLLCQDWGTVQVVSTDNFQGAIPSH